MAVLAEEDNKSSEDKDTDESKVSTKDDEQSNEDNATANNQKDENISSENSEENTSDKTLDNNAGSSEKKIQNIQMMKNRNRDNLMTRQLLKIIMEKKNPQKKL